MSKPALTWDERVERFWARVQKSDGCWQWTGKLSKGYGHVQCPRRKRSINAHRFAYELVNGQIPDGLVVDHMCRNKACVRPDHLRAVTPLINALENSDGPTALNALKTTCPHGHPLAPRAGWAGRPVRQCPTCQPTYRQRHQETMRDLKNQLQTLRERLERIEANNDPDYERTETVKSALAAKDRIADHFRAELQTLRGEHERLACSVHRPAVDTGGCCAIGRTITFWDKQFCEAVEEDDKTITRLTQEKAALEAEVRQKTDFIAALQTHNAAVQERERALREALREVMHNLSLGHTALDLDPDYGGVIEAEPLLTRAEEIGRAALAPRPRHE